MLVDLLKNLRDAKTEKEKTKAYSDLRRVGMDKMTADILLRDSAVQEELNKSEET